MDIGETLTQNVLDVEKKMLYATRLKPQVAE
jgi:hypothetical protein